MRVMVLSVTLLALLAGRPTGATEEIGLAVTEFTSKGGVTQKQMESLGDLLSNEIRDLGGFRVIGQADIRSVLRAEEQKALLNCDDVRCMAEIGGALGVRYIVVGNVGKFGQLFLLNLKVVDTERVRVVASISQKVRGGEEALVEALPQAARSVLGKAGLRNEEQSAAAGGAGKEPGPGVQATPSKPMSAHATWGHAAFWTGLGLAAFGSVAIWQAEEASDDWAATGSSGAASSHENWNGAAYTAFGVGGALMITGAVLWILDPGPEAATTVAGGPSPDGRGISLSVCGRW